MCVCVCDPAGGLEAESRLHAEHINVGPATTHTLTEFKGEGLCPGDAFVFEVAVRSTDSFVDSHSVAGVCACVCVSCVCVCVCACLYVCVCAD